MQIVGMQNFQDTFETRKRSLDLSRFISASSTWMTAPLRSSHLEMFCKKAILKEFAKFTPRHLQWSSSSVKVCNATMHDISKEKLHRRRFLVNFEKFFRTLILCSTRTASSVSLRH